MDLMINYFYSKTNIRSYLNIIILIMGIISYLMNYHFITILLLIISVILKEDIYVRDIFIQYKNDLFLLKFKELLWFKSSIIIILFISLIFILGSNYYLFVLIFYMILLSISIYNFIISFLNNRIIKILNIDEVLDNAIKIKSIIKESDYYIFNDDFQYRINRSFCEYNKLRKLL